MERDEAKIREEVLRLVGDNIDNSYTYTDGFGLERMLYEIDNEARSNEIAVLHNNKLCKIEHGDYYPDEDGYIIFKRKIDWSSEGFCIGELEEILVRYGDRLKDVYFEDYDGSVEKVRTSYETEEIGNYGEFFCLVVVGEEDSGFMSELPKRVNTDTVYDKRQLKDYSFNRPWRGISF